MRAVVQRCDGAQVSVAGKDVGGFAGPGLLTLVGVSRSDNLDDAKRLAAKIWGLRIFDSTDLPQVCVPPGSPKEVSASDVDLPVLVVSQFTLYGKTNKGRRPTWEDAARGPQAEPLIESVVEQLRGLGACTYAGIFGADMKVTSTNDGPFTVLLET
jgi:D-tyrosyl-tRNA(Tyr) deacylase